MGDAMRSEIKKQRHKQLINLLHTNPLLTDEELAASLGVSLSTVRLDRGLLSIPELRERMRYMAEQATSRLTSLREEEVVGELLELEPNQWALSMLTTSREMAFRHTDIVGDYFLYAQAATLAIATIGEGMVVIGDARLRYRQPAYVGEKITARSKVGTHKGNKYAVSVHSRVGDREIFVGRFVVAAIDSGAAPRLEEREC
jgi:acyl-coenzyme A thioesterase PaaI-like protein